MTTINFILYNQHSVDYYYRWVDRVVFISKYTHAIKSNERIRTNDYSLRTIELNFLRIQWIIFYSIWLSNIAQSIKTSLVYDCHQLFFSFRIFSPTRPRNFFFNCLLFSCSVISLFFFRSRKSNSKWEVDIVGAFRIYIYIFFPRYVWWLCCCSFSFLICFQYRKKWMISDVSFVPKYFTSTKCCGQHENEWSIQIMKIVSSQIFEKLTKTKCNEVAFKIELLKMIEWSVELMKIS